MSGDSRIDIAVGVIYNTARDRVLVAKRPDNVDHGGLWEFPGGKREAGETVRAALQRELLEELNLEVLDAVPMLSIDHDYPGRAVRLNVWEVGRWQGGITGREGQQIEWVLIRELGQRRFPEANRSIIAAVSMHSLYVITPNLKHYDEDFFLLTRQLLRAGMSMLQFRSTHTHGDVRAQIISRLTVMCGESGCLLILNDGPAEAVRHGAAGVHLNSARLLQLNERPLETSFLVGASCHNATEVMHASALALDYIFLGPVRKTTTHPGATPMGWRRFEALAGQARLPVYALGGMRPEDMQEARSHGARGLAVITGVWGARDPEEAISLCRPPGITVC